MKGLIPFVKVAKECFIKHFGYDKSNFVADNFSFKLFYRRFFIAFCEQVPLMV